MLNKNKKKLNKGFTVVEMLVVITIIGVMATFVGVGYFGYVQQSKEAITKVEAQEIYKAIELTFVNGSFGDYTSISELDGVESETIIGLLESECGLILPDGAYVEVADGELTYEYEGVVGSYRYE